MVYSATAAAERPTVSPYVHPVSALHAARLSLFHLPRENGLRCCFAVIEALRGATNRPTDKRKYKRNGLMTDEVSVDTPVRIHRYNLIIIYIYIKLYLICRYRQVPIEIVYTRTCISTYIHSVIEDTG